MWVFCKSECVKQKKYVFSCKTDRKFARTDVVTLTVACGNVYTFLHPLMWVFFWSKYVKFVFFPILKDYTWTNVDTLTYYICNRKQ